jgi:amidophosphoribosyltransferase
MDRLCRACFDGEYPIPLPDQALRGKHALEQPTLPLDGDPDASGAAAARPTLGGEEGLEVLLGSIGGADALTRP